MGSQTSKISSLTLASFEAVRSNALKGARGRPEELCDKLQAPPKNEENIRNENEAEGGELVSSSTPDDRMITRSHSKSESNSNSEDVACAERSVTRRAAIEKRLQKRNRAISNTRRISSSEMRTRGQVSPKLDKKNKKDKSKDSVSRNKAKRVDGSATASEGMAIEDVRDICAAPLKRGAKYYTSAKDMENRSANVPNEHSCTEEGLGLSIESGGISSCIVKSRSINASNELVSFPRAGDAAYVQPHVESSFYQTPNILDGPFSCLQPSNFPIAGSNNDVGQHYFARMPYHGQHQPSLYGNWHTNFGVLDGTLKPYTDQACLQYLPTTCSSNLCAGNDKVKPSTSFFRNSDLRVDNSNKETFTSVERCETFANKEAHRSAPKRTKANRAAHQARPANPRRKSSAGSASEVLVTKETLPVPLRRFSHGCEVHVVDEENKVFVVDLVQFATCDLIVKIADEHCARAEKNGNQGWRTLYTYSKMDLPCGEVAVVKDMVADIMKQVIKIVGDLYCDPKGAANLRPRSWKEPHLLRYQKGDGVAPHTGICEHYDGCDVTWQLMLTDVDDYEGGGTYFRSLKKTVKLRKGQVLIHPGELYHKGLDITHGLRELVVCFLDGFDPKIIDHSDPKESLPEHEKEVLLFPTYIQGEKIN